MQTLMVFQVENALKEAGDKIDANDKAAVEADLNALKDLTGTDCKCRKMTDSQVADIKAATGEDDGKCSEAFR